MAVRDKLSKLEKEFITGGSKEDKIKAKPIQLTTPPPKIKGKKGIEGIKGIKGKKGKPGRPQTWQTKDTIQVRWQIPAELVTKLKIRAITERKSQQDIIIQILNKGV